jgi:hypothetical protein
MLKLTNIINIANIFFIFSLHKINLARAITTTKMERNCGKYTTKRMPSKRTTLKASTGVNSVGISSGASLPRVSSATVSQEQLKFLLSI